MQTENKCWKCGQASPETIAEEPLWLLDLLCWDCKIEYLKELIEIIVKGKEE